MYSGFLFKFIDGVNLLDVFGIYRKLDIYCVICCKIGSWWYWWI